MVIPLNHDELTYAEMSQALEDVNIIKQKRKWGHQGKSLCKWEKAKNIFERWINTGNPNILVRVLITTLVIDAYKGREVATFDVQGAYLHADMPKGEIFLEIERNICGYNVSYQTRAQEELEGLKCSEVSIYFGIACHIWVHKIGCTVVQIILRNINVKRF